MGRRGPPPKSAARKKLAGNPGKRKLAKSASLPPPASSLPPDCPAWLDAIGQIEWARVAPELARLGLYEIIDRAALACYCRAYSDLVHAAETIDREGRVFATEKGYLVKHPAVTMAAEAMQRLKTFALEFGFSPAARARVTPKQAGPADPLIEFLAGAAAEPKREAAASSLQPRPKRRPRKT